MTRLPPQNIEAEESVLGSVMIDPEMYTEVERLVEADDFYREANREVYRAIGSLINKGEPIDLVLVTEQLRRQGSLARVGGVPYLLGLMDRTPVAAYAGSYADKVREKARLRDLINVCGTLMNDAYTGREEFTGILSKADTELTRLIAHVHKGTSDSEAVDAALAYLDGTAKVKTGFSSLDELTGGLPIGDLTTLGARSTTGKSALSYQIAVEIISASNIKVGILSPDQEKGAIVSTLAARLAQVPLPWLESGRANPTQRQTYGAAVVYVNQHILPNLIINDAVPHYLSVESEVNRLVRQGCGVIFVDTLQAINEGKEIKRTQIDHTCRTLKGLARQYRIPIVAISQIKQTADYQQDKRPRDYDLSESKNIYDLSQTVLLLYRDSLSNGYDSSGIPAALRTEPVEIRAAKQKTGRKNGVARLQFLPDLQIFKNQQGIVPGISIKSQPFNPAAFTQGGRA